MKSLALFLPLVFLFACQDNNPQSYDVVIHNIRLFDGNEDRGIVNIAIDSQFIANISKSELNGRKIIDGTGKFIVPGLVNAHTHVWHLDDIRESYTAGITTVFDLHQGDPRLDARLRTYRDSLGYADYFGSGPLISVEGGYPSHMKKIDPINDSLSIVQAVDNRIRNGADVIKVVKQDYDFGDFIIDRGYKQIPSLSYKQIQQIIEVSHDRGYQCIIHILDLKHAVGLAKFKPDGYAHLWTWDEELTKEKIDALKEAELFIIPTVLLQKRANADLETDTIYSQEEIEYGKEHFLYPDEKFEAHIFKLYEAGIPIVAGNDPPNNNVNFGTDLIRELEIYHRSGLPLIEVLKTATGNAAKYLPIEGRGSLEVGNRATFLF